MGDGSRIGKVISKPRRGNRSCVFRGTKSYFGPTAPDRKEGNWAYTKPGKSWFMIFRFYGPEKPLFDKSWQLPDIVQVNH